MTLPPRILAAGLTWPVRTRAKLTSDGLCRPKEQDILLHRDCVNRIDRARKTLLHEMLHAMLYDRLELYENEELILLLEDRLDEVLRMNPDFLWMYGYEVREDG